MVDSLNMIAYRVLESLRSEIGDDDSIDLREIKYDIHNQRALWLKNELIKSINVNETFVQDLGCVKLESVASSDCCDISGGCKVLRTIQEIPKTIPRKNKDGIIRVGPVDKMDYPFSYVTHGRAIVSGNGRFNYNTVFAFPMNNRIYLKINPNNMRAKGLKYINVRGIMEDPTEVARFNTCTGNTCYTDDSPYPISKALLNYIIGEVVNKYLNVDVRVPGDKTNDANNNLKQ